jgi:hypothetical protein
VLSDSLLLWIFGTALATVPLLPRSCSAPAPPKAADALVATAIDRGRHRKRGDRIYLTGPRLFKVGASFASARLPRSRGGSKVSSASLKAQREVGHPSLGIYNPFPLWGF